MRYTSAFHLVGLLGGLGLGGSCTDLLSNHCANLNGNRTCEERGMGSFCNACSNDADGCSVVMPLEGCYFPGLGEGSGSGSIDATEAEGGEMTVGVGTSLNPDSGGACGSDAECEAPTPFCVSGTCEECSVDVLGACGGATPVCDGESNVCVACNEHAQCGEAACNFFTGECLPANSVVHVGASYDFTTLSAAAASFGPGAQGTMIVHDLNVGVNDTVAVDDGRVLAFLAHEDAQPLWDNGDGNGRRHLVVANGTILMDGLTVFRYYNPTLIGAVRVSGNESRVWIDYGRIVDNNGGIRVENGAEVILRNSFLNARYGTIGLEVVNASATVLYSTVATTAFITTPALSCDSLAAVEIRNSIIVTHGGLAFTELSCDGDSVSIMNSVTEPESGFDSAWFVDFDADDLHLTQTGATVFAGIAQWRAGDPTVDIDDEPRPSIAGSSDYPGADRPLPQ